MSFISVQPPAQSELDPETELTISQDWWPDICLSTAREILRLSGTVTNVRLREALQNAAYSINAELSSWRHAQQGIESLEDARICALYQRAVFWTAKAELTELYRDYDTTGAGDRHAERLEISIDESRRIARWAVSDILGKPRLMVEAL